MGSGSYSLSNEKWQEVFKIEIRETKPEKPGILGTKLFHKYAVEKFALIDIRTKEVIGLYDDYKYAKKQARYRYKKIINKIDRMLLG